MSYASRGADADFFGAHHDAITGSRRGLSRVGMRLTIESPVHLADNIDFVGVHRGDSLKRRANLCNIYQLLLVRRSSRRK